MDSNMKAPGRICPAPGCGIRIEGKQYCSKHKGHAGRRYDEQRPTAPQRGYDSRWQKARKTWLAEHPLCAECERQGRVRGATLVDHIVPHSGDYQLFWDSEGNWQSLCVACHQLKSMKERANIGII